MKEHIYFLGIGGIGMSALARYHLHIGNKVSGYDRYRSELCEKLESEGMDIHYEDRPDELATDIDRVVYTPAVPSSLGEFQELKSREIPFEKRALELGRISNRGISMAVAGTHGKTSITGILSHLMANSSKGCQAFLGGISKNFNSNVHFSGSDHFVLEADEYDRSFLQLTPNYLLISSVEADHLDIYGTDKQIRQSFLDLTSRVKTGGEILLREGVLPEVSAHRYSLVGGTAFYGENMSIEEGCFVFDLVHPKGVIRGIRFAYPGRHNLENAVGASGMALMAGVSEEDLKIGLESFFGMERRFDLQHSSESTIYIDDYAHHPTEISTTLRSIRELYPQRKMSVIFQPHLYSRTRDFAMGFGESLSLADEVFLVDIYPAREAPIAGVSSQLILENLSIGQKKLVDKTEFLEYLKSSPPELLVSMGAGDISEWVEPITKTLQSLD
jgi:UDP-N-acetylmuramate--alanine ligase